MAQDDHLLASFVFVWHWPSAASFRDTNFQLVTSPIIAAQPASAPTVDELCRTHLALVHHEVRSISMRLPGHVHTDDLTSAGMSALFGAAGSFDPEQGVPFARYAARRIRGALLDELRSADWATRSLRGRVRERNSMYESLTAHLGRTPSPDELARGLGISRAELQRIEGDLHQSVVLRIDHLATEAGADAILPVHRRDPRVRPGRARAPVLPARRRPLPARAAAEGRPRLLLRGPADARARRGARGHRVADLPAAGGGAEAAQGRHEQPAGAGDAAEEPRVSRPTGARRTTPRSPAAPRSTRASACPACARPRWPPRPPDRLLPFGSALVAPKRPVRRRSDAHFGRCRGNESGRLGDADQSGRPKKVQRVSQVAPMAADESPVGTGR